MGSSPKVLGQALPAANADTVLDTVPANVHHVASTLTVCNQDLSSNATIRVAVRPAGVALLPVHYFLYEIPIDAGDTDFYTIGLTLAATDVVSVQSSNASTSFHLYGTELS